MCIILVGKINRSQHSLAELGNPEGFSVYTAEAGLLKAPTPSDVTNAIGKFGIWHYRIATSGSVDENNIHPFRICGGSYYLYHNGILGAGKDNLSDTHALADTLMDVSLTTARSVVSSLSTSQRFLIVSASNPLEFYLYGAWSVEGGVLMSHKLVAYTTAYTEYKGGKYGTSWDVYRR